MDASIPCTNPPSNHRAKIKNHFSLQTKQDALQRIFLERQPIAYVARNMGLSESTVRSWYRSSEKIFNLQNVNVPITEGPFDPRQTQRYNNYYQQHQMFFPQFAQPYYHYQQMQHVQLETPPLTPPLIDETNESLNLSSVTKDVSNMKIEPTNNTFPPHKQSQSSDKILKRLDELFFVNNNNMTESSNEDVVADRTSAIEAGEVFLAWMSTCPELSSNSNLKVLRGTLERLKKYTPSGMKRKDGILDLSTRRKK